MASLADQKHARSLLKAYESRLRQREIQVATLGILIDPSIPNEIEALKESIEQLKAHKPQSPIIIEAQNVVRSQYDNELEFIIADGQIRNKRQTRLEEKHDGLAITVGDMSQKLLVIVDDILENKKDADYGRLRNYRLQLVNIAILLAIVLFLVFK